MKERIEHIRKQIRQAAINCGRNPSDIRLIGVSKTVPAEIVRQAIEAGTDILGENYIQEAKEKIAALSTYSASWHFIGHLQTNKAKYAVKLFDLIHTVDSLKLAQELNRQAAKFGKIQEILIEINVGSEETKSGVSAAEALPLIRNIGNLANLSVRGLMTIPPFYDEPEKVRPYFKALRELRDTVRAQSIPGISMNELSMGMSGDFQTAIEEGATMVRIGTAIFGGRGVVCL